MANNRLFLCEVDDEGNVLSRVKIAKHTGGAWFLFMDEGHVNQWLEEVFSRGNAIALTDEYVYDKPLERVFPYNDQGDSDGTD